MSYKLNWFFGLLNNFRPINYIVGLGPYSIGFWNTDFDLGYLFTYYGLVGMLLYLPFMINLYFYRSIKKMPFDKLSKFICLISVIFGFSGGVFFNARIFSIFLLIAFTKVNVQEGENV